MVEVRDIRIRLQALEPVFCGGDMVYWRYLIEYSNVQRARERIAKKKVNQSRSEILYKAMGFIEACSIGPPMGVCLSRLWANSKVFFFQHWSGMSIQKFF